MPAREHARRVGAASACVWLLTALGVLLARLAPALAPSPRPAATPQAMASTFLAAPPISTPRTSVE